MTYSDNYPVRLVGGRLALNLVNTADWSADGAVVHEKIKALSDLGVWLDAMGLPDAEQPHSIKTLHSFREELRVAIGSGEEPDMSSLHAHLQNVHPADKMQRQPILALAAISALSILADPREHSRIKMCPGDDCGWMFIDETKNGRRKWCLMETCGNRAKSARHYQKIVKI